MTATRPENIPAKAMKTRQSAWIALHEAESSTAVDARNMPKAESQIARSDPATFRTVASSCWARSSWAPKTRILRVKTRKA
jgi:uncharacterized protein YecT (DUF1311 family)